MGSAHWSAAGESEEALDALVARDVQDHRPLRLTLLGRQHAVSGARSDYNRLGRYPNLTVRLSAVEDPVTAEIARLHEQRAAIELKEASLEVIIDSREAFSRRFSFTQRDEHTGSGDFQLATSLSAVPAWMLRSMKREGTAPAPSAP
jgi:hypothetical protein